MNLHLSTYVLYRYKRSVYLHWFMVFSTDSVMALKKRLHKDQNFRLHNISKWRKHGNLQSLKNKLIAWWGEKNKNTDFFTQVHVLVLLKYNATPILCFSMKFNSSGSKIYFPCIKKFLFCPPIDYRLLQ